MDKEGLSELLSKKLNKEVVVKEIVAVGSGYHSDGYKLVTESGDSYFIKRIKSEDMGFEFPERKITSLLVSHSMLKRHNNYPNSLGVVIKNEKFEFLPDINDSTEVYQIQEYGGEGKSYLELLEKKTGKSEIDQTDRDEIDKVIDFIAQIHKTKPTNKDTEMQRAIYNDYLRSVIGHPEYLLLLLQRVPDDSPVLKPSEQGEFISLVWENMHYFKDHPERLTAIHGDFWGSNLFFRDDGSVFVIDYSRMPWGDPGFDVGIWMSQYLIRYHMGNQSYFRQLGDYFLEQYIKKTGDSEVVKTMVYALAVIAVIYSSEARTPGVPDEARVSFYNNVMGMLKKKEFFWS